MSAVDAVQSLVLRPPPGDRVTHLLLRLPDQGTRVALGLIGTAPVSFGVPKAGTDTVCSLGITFAGLRALGVPEGYLRVFRRLAPAFAEGPVLRADRLGDAGASAPERWVDGFRHEQSHLVLSWHGNAAASAAAEAFADRWTEAFSPKIARLAPVVRQQGSRLGAPPGQTGEWVHFGLRDGLSEIRIDDEWPLASSPDPRPYPAGTLLLGRVDAGGSNRFALSLAPARVRDFFLDASFGILRPMQQDLRAFAEQVQRFKAVLATQFDMAQGGLSDDFVKAKLSGRWPDGRQILPGDLHSPSGTLRLNFDRDADGKAIDPEGQGCPFGSHVRRMRAIPDAQGRVVDRPLQRRGVPFGPAHWSGPPPPDDTESRGLIGQFFCASIEEQFEHLLGLWAARPPLGLAAGDRAQDPLIGPHDDPDAALRVPLQQRRARHLTGWSPWTTTLGTLYAWHPSRIGLDMLLRDDFNPDTEGPWA